MNRFILKPGVVLYCQTAEFRILTYVAIKGSGKAPYSLKNQNIWQKVAWKTVKNWFLDVFPVLQPWRDFFPVCPLGKQAGNKPNISEVSSGFGVSDLPT